MLLECMAVLARMGAVDVFLSKAAEEVLRCYDYRLDLPEGTRVYREGAASAPVVGRFYRGGYRALVIAPATSNSVAKMVMGISDTLVTNLFAHAGKCRVPSIVLPCDTGSELQSEAPDGVVPVYPRRIDIENAQRLAAIEYTVIVETPDKLEAKLGPYMPGSLSSVPHSSVQGP
jgi:flavoprotein